MRIAFIANPMLPGGWYRGIGPMGELGERGHEIVQLWRDRDGIRARQIAGCDLLHVHREHSDDVLKVVRAAKELGMAVVYDNDDDMRAVPRNLVAYRGLSGFAGERVLRQLRRLLAQADVAIATSEQIAARFREYGATDVRQIENFVPNAVLDTTAPPNRDHVVMGWVAGTEHRVDVERLPLREALGRALDACPQLVVETIGISLGVRHERYRHVPRLDFFDLHPAMAAWDVGLAPLADHAFNHARSNIKVKEYAALGKPWLASPIGPYAPLGEKHGGRLVPDERWTEEVVRLATKPRERRKLARNARKWGRTQSIAANIGLWEDALEQALARARAGSRDGGLALSR